jgi:hypothetical protein
LRELRKAGSKPDQAELRVAQQSGQVHRAKPPAAHEIFLRKILLYKYLVLYLQYKNKQHCPMIYSGWYITFCVNGKPSIEGPISTIEEAKKKYNDLQLLSPVVTDRRIGRMMVNPSNPEFTD